MDSILQFHLQICPLKLRSATKSLWVPRAKQEETAFWNQKWGKTWSLGSCYPFSALTCSLAFNEKEQWIPGDGISGLWQQTCWENLTSEQSAHPFQGENCKIHHMLYTNGFAHRTKSQQEALSTDYLYFTFNKYCSLKPKNMWHYKSDQQQCLSSACTKAFGLFSNPRFQTMEHYNIWYPDKLQLDNQELQQGSASNTDIEEGAANTLVLQSLEYQVMVLAANFVHLFVIWSAGHHLGKLRQHKTSITKISNSSAPRD